ncbi:MAG: DNA repair protein RadC [Ignavibacteria bacterium]|nr:DNA repair protein RadC [Ignavibacteria bacterium]
MDSDYINEISRQKVKEMDKDSRPREKLQKFGCTAMENYELIAILLRTGRKGMNVLELAQYLIRKYERLEKLFNLTVDELKKIKGIGLAKATELLATFCLAKRYHQELIENERRKLYNKKIDSPATAAEEVRRLMIDDTKEGFFVLCLDAKNRVLDYEIVSSGTLTASLVHPRETFRTAIKRNAAGIIVFHNHPSGDPTPSEDDIKVTRKLFEAGNIIDIKLIDHIIITREKYFSMKDKGYI